MRAGAQCGAKAVEFDIQTTKDGRLVLSHDEYLGRAIQGQGRVCDMTSDDLRHLQVVNPAAPGEKANVTFFDETVRLCNELGLMMNVELKPAEGCEDRLAEAAAKAFAELSIEVPVLVSSFSASCLAAFHALSPQQACGFLYEDAATDWERIASEVGARTVHPRADLPDKEMVCEAHGRGLGVMVWTVDDKAQAESALLKGGRRGLHKPPRPAGAAFLSDQRTSSTITGPDGPIT